MRSEDKKERQYEVSFIGLRFTYIGDCDVTTYKLNIKNLKVKAMDFFPNVNENNKFIGVTFRHWVFQGHTVSVVLSYSVARKKSECHALSQKMFICSLQ